MHSASMEEIRTDGTQLPDRLSWILSAARFRASRLIRTLQEHLPISQVLETVSSVSSKDGRAVLSFTLQGSPGTTSNSVFYIVNANEIFIDWERIPLDWGVRYVAAKRLFQTDRIRHCPLPEIKSSTPQDRAFAP